MPKRVPAYELEEIARIVTLRPEGVSLEEITRELSSSLAERTLQRRLAALVEQGRLRAEGEKRGTRYFAPAKSGDVTLHKNTYEGDGYSNYPRFSVDGTQITYVSHRSGSSEIWVMKADGSAQTQLTFDGTTRRKMLPSFSSDGQKIIFSASTTAEGTSAESRSDIYVMNRDGSNVSQISIGDGAPADGAPDEFRFAYAAEFSPDGRKIAFSTSMGGIYSGQGKIYAMNRDGTQPQVLCDNSDSPYPNSSYYSPDGKKMIFSSFRDGGNNLYVMNSDGSGLTKITSINGEHRCESPCWSPNGTKIVYNSLDTYTSQLAVVNANGTGKVGITPDDGNNYFVEPSWGPGFVAAPASASPAAPNPSASSS